MELYVDRLPGQPDAHVKLIHQEQAGENLYLVIEVNSSSATCQNATKSLTVLIAATAGG